MSERDLEQSLIVKQYIEENPLKATCVLSTGFGKSKVAIDILKELRPKKVLILVNSTVLRDFSWRDEFVKFKAVTLFKSVELSTYQTAYKWKKEEKDLTDYFVIADEVDFAANTDELSKFFYEYPEVKVLGLTGYITEDKKAWFEEHLPVLKELTAHDAQGKGILNNLHFVFVKYDLSTNPKDVKVDYKEHGVQKSFYQSESNAYDYQNKAVQVLVIEQEKAVLAHMSGEITKHELDVKVRGIKYRIDQAVQKRADLLLNSIASRTVTKKLVTYLQTQKPENKIIIFSKRTEQSISICGIENSYNGKIPKKVADVMFQNFQNGTLKVLGVCDKVNRGVNIDNLRTAIFESFYGSDTEATQRFGRMMRLKPDEIATVYILLPFYMRKERNNTYTVQETQQVKWARAMMSSTIVKSHTVWDYRVVKENPKT